MTNNFRILVKGFFAGVLLFHASGRRSKTPSTDKQRLARFEKQANELRALLKIPGMSAVIVREQEVLWAKGFGYADLENRIAATPDTVYHIASLTKTFAATLLMQLVEQRKLDLDEPVSDYSSDFKDDLVKIKHLLSHTSDGTPGERYQYSGNRYDYLTTVIEKKSSKSFRERIVEAFLDPLRMSSSVPAHDVVGEADKWAALLGKENLNRYAKSLSRLAQPYTLYGDREIIHVPYPPKDVNAAAGLLSTVLDMAQYDAAIDRHVFLKKETQEKAWTPFVSNSGQPLRHGLGWFVTDYHGIKLIWHYGHWGTGFSAIYLKVPEKNISLVMLANSEALSDHQFQVDEDITNNVFACAFLRLFVLDEAQPYDCERNSQTALTKWIEDRRAQARLAIPLDPSILETYMGQYQFETFPLILTVTKEDSRLFVDIPKDGRSELFAESESTFFLKIRPLQMTFIKDKEQITHIEVVEYGETWRANKIK